MVMAFHGHWHRALLALIVFCLPAVALAQTTEPEEPQEAFIELSASADDVYVQQQLRLTVKLYYTNQVIQGQLTDPEHPNAVIEKLGEQKQYRELINGERYRVVEREYVIFPQNPGQLQLPPLEFQGTARHPRGHHYRIADSAVLFPVTVRDSPAGFSGRTWLPATDLSISERGLERTGPVAPGDSLTRTLTLSARGLPATTLPPLDSQYPDAVRSYPEPEQRQSSVGEDGVVGKLTQTVALVPMAGSGGEITLPEVRIPWWDVNEDREKVAILPARTLRLTASAGPVEPAAQNRAREPNDANPGLPTASGSGNRTGWFWPIVAGLMLLGWLTTAAAWWLQRRRKSPLVKTPGQNGEKDRFDQLCHQARALDAAFFNGFPGWVATLTGRPCRTTDQGLALLSNDRLTQAIQHWREVLFRSSGGTKPNAEELVKALKQARRHWQQQTGGKDGQYRPLPDLYPEGLRP